MIVANRRQYYEASHAAREATRKELNRLRQEDRSGFRVVKFIEYEDVRPSMRRRFNLPKSKVSEIGVLVKAQQMRRRLFVKDGRYCKTAMVKPKPIAGSYHETLARRELEAVA